ncbi:MAG: AGE family epimerase/isomerase [Paracoccaceae bacterium]
MPTEHPQDWEQTGGPIFINRLNHRQWLLAQVASLLDFFQPNVINTAGGFHTLDASGRPLPPGPGKDGHERKLHDTARTVHCFAIAKLLGRAGASDIIDHGMDFLWTRHRDVENGGYFWGVDDTSTTNSGKLAYGHAFVLLAAASAKTVGHPDADRLLNDVSEVLHSRFWEPDIGATSEEYSADWQEISDYRGQNSNMHLTEALMAAYEATGNETNLDMAGSIVELIINRHARQQGWRVAEHFDADWQVDRAYAGDPMFRPAGITPGHALEWARLLIQLWELGGQHASWMPEAAKNLFLNAVNTGWNHETGGFFYTLAWDDTPDRTDRYWWPCAEGIGAAAVLTSFSNDPVYETWYRRIWGFVDAHLIDHHQGGWYPELDDDLRPVSRVFTGKPDLYHALQACLIPLLPADGSITRGLVSMPLHVRDTG